MIIVGIVICSMSLNLGETVCTKMKHLFVKTVVKNSHSLPENKNFTQKRALQISQNDARIVDKQEDKKTEEKCTMLFVLNVVQALKSHSNQCPDVKFFVKFALKLKSNNKEYKIIKYL